VILNNDKPPLVTFDVGFRYLCNMSTAEEIKQSLHQLIDQINDESKLRVVYSAFGENQDWWDDLTDSDKESIQIGLDQLEKGNSMDYNDVKKKADSILGRCD